jgi:glycosyltransferase involved in cell wall biosynthesis
VDWHIDLAGEALSRVLPLSDICYLPFPDGASERRSSLIALLANGAAVVTTKGKHTPAAMGEAVLFASSASEALERVRGLEANPARKSSLQRQAANYAKKFGWKEIAMRHISLYESILRQRRSE